MSDAEVQQEKGVEESAESKQPGFVTFETKGNAKTTKERTIKLTWKIGKDVAESSEIFGEQVVKSMFDKAIVIAAQANVRRMLEAENEDGTFKYTDEQIENFLLNTYKPGVRTAREGGSSVSMEKLVAKLMKMSPEDRKKALAEAGLSFE